ncbi:phage tail protein [Devosia sp. FJ2-5-3]|uniref:phage tail protein n=1 Tax=Devosia sp. FJ2-5-3 TaxID=2976680 RepID=UPI0023D83C16|nr:phage tail protein [Devosia sp. FJ2-5-3]WEJ60418.1 phage tail protein [Devosia sp. FJ2-5-3]
MRLGPVEFDLAVNPQEVTRKTQTPYAVHPVVGARPIREFTGEGDGTFSITGVVFPHHFGGGRLGLAALEIARQAHTPVPFMRGNLVPLGWVLIEALEISDSEIGQFGIGTEVGFTATLVLTDRPTVALAPAILSLFA